MNDKSTRSPVAVQLQEAYSQVEVNALYAHYRSPDQHYKVLSIALDEATEQPCVVYQALYGEGLIWVRDLRVWCETVEHMGRAVPRFKILKSMGSESNG